MVSKQGQDLSYSVSINSGIEPKWPTIWVDESRLSYPQLDPKRNSETHPVVAIKLLQLRKLSHCGPLQQWSDMSILSAIYQNLSNVNFWPRYLNRVCAGVPKTAAGYKKVSFLTFWRFSLNLFSIGATQKQTGTKQLKFRVSVKHCPFFYEMEELCWKPHTKI